MKILLPRLLVCVVVFALFFSGCRKEKVGKTTGEQTGEKPSENIVALVGDEQITRGEFEAALERVPQNRRERYRDRVLEHLIQVKVFSKEARREGLDKDPQTKRALDRGTNETLARYFVKKYVDQQAEPSEEEVRKYYEEHKDEFVVPEGVLIQHILVKKQQKAEALLKDLKEGASFEELAKKRSIARSWKKGGQLGWLYKGRMEPEMEKVAFVLEKRKLSDVIQTKKGYQIIKVLDTSAKREIGFDEANSRIRNALFRRNKRDLIHKYYKEAKVERDPGEKGVLVKVGDEAFTEETLAPILVKVSEKETEKFRRRWIKYFIETKVFSKEAKKVGLQNDPEVAADLKRKTEEVLAEAFRKRFIADKFPVTDQDVAEYYQSHLEQFRIPLRLRVKSILVKTKEEAEEILKELKEGAAFGSLAMKRSIQPSASRAGEIGWFAKGEKDPALEKVAFSLEKGKISHIIKTEAGYEIIKLMDRKGGNIKTLDQVRQAIKMSLFRQKFEEEKQRYYKKAGVKVLGS